MPRLRPLYFVFLITFTSTLLFPRLGASIETSAKAAILIEVATGEILFEKNPDTLMPPASMSKLMTLYMLFERLKTGALSLEDKFRVSENAWRKGGAKSGSSTMFLEPRKKVTVEDLIRGIIVQSGNDACIVVAEALSGSETVFAEEMTEKARKLGMQKSTFMNSTGWPHPEHRTTPRDLAILTQRLISEFPEFYHYFSEREFTFNGIRQANRNPLLYKEINADGLKTGHTLESGYGLTASVLRRNRRLVAVVNGLTSKKARSAEPEKLLEWGFREFSNYMLFKSSETVEMAETWLGAKKQVPLTVGRDIYLTLHRQDRNEMAVKVVYTGPIPAPITKGQEIAKLVISTPTTGVREYQLLAGTDIAQLGFVGRLWAALQSIIWGETG